MKRRTFVAFLGGALAARISYGQSASAMYRVAFVLNVSPLSEMEGLEPAHPILLEFVREMRRLGYAEGVNLILERRTLEGQPKRPSGELLASSTGTKATKNDGVFCSISVAGQRVNQHLTPGWPRMGPVRACSRPWTCCEPHLRALGLGIAVGRVAIGRTSG